MRKSWWVLCLCLAAFCATGRADEIVGFWKSFHEKTEKAQCIFAIYEYQDRYYGRIIGTYDSVTGEMVDTVYAPKKRAKGLMGDPFFSGLDIIWSLRYKGPKYKGKIVDPQSGSTYDVEVWREGSNLVVRGKLLFFGRNVTWMPALEEDFPVGFQKPNVAEFVPSLPVAK